MGKIQYKNNQQSEVNYSRPVKHKRNPINQQISFKDIDKAELVDACHQVFDSMVTRDFLHSLSECSVKPLPNKSYTKVRWYRIDKIVMEKDVFFADKLSMLYMSLHKTAKNIILVLNKQNDGDIELYLGARDFSGSSSVSGKILEAGLEGFFPGIRFEQDNINKLQFKNPAISSVSAIASLRDDKKEDFVQGIERLINATSSIPQFRAYFVADSVDDVETNGMINAFNQLYSSLSPAETLQMTFNESETKGISESFTENFSESIGESISKTVTHTDGYSENDTESDTETDGSSENYSRNILTSIWYGLVGGRTGSGKNRSNSRTQAQTIGKNFSDSEANQKGSNRNTTKGTANQKGINESTTTGSSKQITYKNRTVKFYLDILDKQLERLQNGKPFGLWSVATYFVANDPTTAQQLSNIYRGSIIGEESGLETCAINTWIEKDSVEEMNRYLENSLHPRFDFNSLDVSAGSVVNSKELAIHLSLPQNSVPGIIVQERASFARNVLSIKKNTNEIHLGNIVHLGQESTTPVNLDIEELTKHLFVTGSTGSGKSNTMYLLLKQLKEKGKTFMVIEPAKGEYKHVFGCLNDVTVYSHTNKMGYLLQINPFVFPFQHVDVLEHIKRIVGIFNACWSLYAAMPSILEHSIITAYEKCGWDVETSTHKFNEPIFPKVDDVVVCVKDYIEQSDYSPDTKGDYKAAIEKRLQDLCEGMFDKMFNRGVIADEDLFNKNTIIDLSRTGSPETNALIMGFLIVKLNEFRMSESGMNQSLKHITVLEEAHNLLKKVSTSQSMETANIAGKSVEMITNSIAEMRTYGESFIIVDQSPSLLDAAAIRNTNTKIVLSLPETEDRKIAGGSMSLNDEQIDEISRQGQGEAIVYQNNWEEPVQCKIDLFEDYQEGYLYSKTTQQSKKPLRVYNVEIVDFLLHPHIKNNIDIDEIVELISNSKMPSSIQFTLMNLVDEYRRTHHVKLWNDYNFAELAFIVKQYINLDNEYINIISQHTNMRQVRRKLDAILTERFNQKLNRNFLFFVEMCYVRNNALYYEWFNTFMNP